MAKAIASGPTNMREYFYLKNRIKDGGIKIDCMDGNVPFLQEIQNMLINQNENVDLARRAGKLLEKLDLKFTFGHRAFANAVFKLKRMCLAVYINDRRL